MPDDMSYMYPAYPIICFFTMLAVLFPIPAHWRAGNIATISLAAWTFFGLLICMVNTIVWHGNLRNPYPIWMDICNVYLAILPTGIGGSTLCIQYRLWSIARSKMVFITKEEKRRQRYTTYFCCFGLAIIIGCLHYVVQGHRGNIVEDIGPTVSTYNVTLAFVLYYPWEPIVCLISGTFSVMTIRLFLAQRKEFDAILASGSSNINKDRYFRLLWLAAVAVVIHLPLASWAIIVNATAQEVHPWISWEDTHSNYKRIVYVTRFLVQQTPSQAVFLSIGYWATVLCGINFFIFFGFGEEATKGYQTLIGTVLKPFGIKYPKEKKRRTIKKTWLDVLLGRPGKPINLTSSFVTSTVPQFASNPTGSRPSKPSQREQRPPTRSQTTTGGNGNDLNIDISHLDFLDPAEAKKQARISAYTRPGQAARKAKLQSDRPASVCSSVHQDSFDEAEEDIAAASPSTSKDEKALEALNTDATNELRHSKAVDSDATTTTTQEKVGDDVSEKDLEAQQKEDEEALAQERRAAILEKNPELTEEVSF